MQELSQYKLEQFKLYLERCFYNFYKLYIVEEYLRRGRGAVEGTIYA
jgi:hypothetical protein